MDSRVILSTTIQNNLMNAARDNTALTEDLALEFQNDISHRKLLSSIHNFITMNKFWENFTTHYKIVGSKNTRNGTNNNTNINNKNHRGENHNGNKDPNKTQAQEDKSKPITIHRSIYPILLEKLTGKLRFLFQLLESGSSLLFGGRYWQVERDNIRTEKKEDT